MARSIGLAALAVSLAGCLAPSEVPPMGSARITSDFSTYSIERVGVIPFRALESMGLSPHEVGSIETGFQSELSTAAPFDFVTLRGVDLAEVLPPEPFRLGGYTPASIRTLRDRYRLDALLVGTITSRRIVPPQVLGCQLDLVSCETGATIWSCDLLLDASRMETRQALDIWAREYLGDEHAAPLALLSPQRFARFAAYQMARML